VLAAFGVTDEVAPLEGGQGQSFADHRVVLKHVGGDDAQEAAWSAEVLDAIEEDGFRVARPVRSRDGQWVVDGWVAHLRVAGDHVAWGGPWPTAIQACRRFHGALEQAARPSFFDRRDHLFAVADRVVWGEGSVDVDEPIATAVRDLEAMLRPVQSPSQVIHGDLAGNLLFADGMPPAVIDFSPYWRPAGHAVAQTIVDAMLWYGADVGLAEEAADIPEIDQFLARALMFRLLVDELQLSSAEPTARFTSSQVEWDLDHARPLIALLKEGTVGGPSDPRCRMASPGDRIG
jgi:uncharacterized protein (TIGR02569 family)